VPTFKPDAGVNVIQYGVETATPYIQMIGSTRLSHMINLVSSGGRKTMHPATRWDGMATTSLPPSMWYLYLH